MVKRPDADDMKSIKAAVLGEKKYPPIPLSLERQINIYIRQR